VELVRRELVPSRAAARRAIEDGLVRVSTVAVPKPSTLVDPSEPVSLVGPPQPFVGRGGLKLDGALDRFGIDVTGKVAIDVGASTGGFTDCLLQRGAAGVVAVDVGYGQLHWSLRADDRVTVIERTNIRTADAGELGAPFDVVVADLSFISLRLVAPQLARLGGLEADWVLLVKPQFEVERRDVGRGGIVRDPAAHRKAIESAVAGLGEAGVGTVGVMLSPITGTAGNREFLLWARRGPVGLRHESIDEVVEAAE
jgi:23S rRNA (cytidine1920-2'-O)/16S rRNA (cytidine1409-2'-O)-methyltransferase